MPNGDPSYNPLEHLSGLAYQAQLLDSELRNVKLEMWGLALVIDETRMANGEDIDDKDTEFTYAAALMNRGLVCDGAPKHDPRVEHWVEYYRKQRGGHMWKKPLGTE